MSLDRISLESIDEKKWREGKKRRGRETEELGKVSGFINQPFEYFGERREKEGIVIFEYFYKTK